MNSSAVMLKQELVPVVVDKASIYDKGCIQCVLLTEAMSKGGSHLFCVPSLEP